MPTKHRSEQLQRFREHLKQDLVTTGRAVYILRQGDPEAVRAMKYQLRNSAKLLGLRIHIKQTYPDVYATHLVVTEAKE